MTHLTLVGLSRDGKRLLLVDDQGTEFTLDADAKLRAALRGEHARLGQLEMKMDSSLRPRDIQARIRSGETPESVASAAGTTVEAIMPFAAPVMAERQHVAERAQRSSVRRSGAGPQAGARTLGEAVGGHLRSLNVDPDSVTWDSARREDGRWTLTADFTAGARSGTAHFTFDAPGNYVLVDNDDAQFLIGGAAATTEAAPPPLDDLQQARARRRSVPPAAPGDQLPLGDDALSLVSEEPSSLGSEAPVEAYLDDDAPTREQPAVTDSPAEPPAAAAEPEPEPTAEPAAEEPAARPARKKGRSSVPSWDEIMFGGGKTD